MNSIIVFSVILAVSLTSAFNLLEPRNYTLQQRIIGGITAPPNKFLYQVAVCEEGSCEDAYSGALIKDQWVLTTTSIVLMIKKIQVQLGMRKLGYPAFKFDVPRSNVFPHRDYRDQIYANIALIKIPHVEFSALIAPAILPLPFGHYMDIWAVVSGWGFTSHPEHVPRPLQYVSLRIISNKECLSSYPGLPINKGHICAQRMQRGICSYDIGAPLVYENTRLLIGIASFRHAGRCGIGRAIGFTRVDEYLEWINDTIVKNTKK